MNTIYVVHEHEQGGGSTIIGAITDEKLAKKLANASDRDSGVSVVEITPVPIVVEVSGLTADELAVLRAAEHAEAIDPAQLSDIPFLIKEGLLDLRAHNGHLKLTLTTQGRFALECAKPDDDVSG